MPLRSQFLTTRLPKRLVDRTIAPRIGLLPPPDDASATASQRWHDRVGRDWLWYERRLLGDEALTALLDRPGHGQVVVEPIDVRRRDSFLRRSRPLLLRPIRAGPDSPSDLSSIPRCSTAPCVR